MNSKFLLLAILAIQLNNASILNDKNIEESVDKVKINDIKSLEFSSSKYVKINGKNFQQLKCIGKDQRKKLCNRYNGTSAFCENQNYQIEETEKWKCKITGMSVTNENVFILAVIILCKTKETNHSQYIFPNQCKMWYVFDKDAEYNLVNDVHDSKNSFQYDPKYVFEYELDDETKKVDFISANGIKIVFGIGLALAFGWFVCFKNSCSKGQK